MVFVSSRPHVYTLCNGISKVDLGKCRKTILQWCEMFVCLHKERLFCKAIILKTWSYFRIVTSQLALLQSAV